MPADTILRNLRTTTIKRKVSRCKTALYYQPLKTKLLPYYGSRVRLYVIGDRNRITDHRGILDGLYPSLFTVTVDRGRFKHHYSFYIQRNINGSRTGDARFLAVSINPITVLIDAALAQPRRRRRTELSFYGNKLLPFCILPDQIVSPARKNPPASTLCRSICSIPFPA